ncbi:MAG: hypothetical protein WAL30_02770 [Candidatus Aquirickettsiella sp.]
MLYTDGKENEITDNKSNYKEAKDFILSILGFEDINLKLKYFDLTIKLLEKVKADIAEPHFNKKSIGALDLLKKFVTEEKYIPNEADLKYISDLGRESNEADIRKSFYGIIHELDKKLLFQDLLKQLLEIIENEKNLPLIQFRIIFIKKCLGDAQMDAGDLHQAIHIIHSALIECNKKVKPIIIFNRVVWHNLINLDKFEESLQEKISLLLTDNLVNSSSQKQESNQVALILKKFDFAAFFTTDVNNKKIKLKLHASIKEKLTKWNSILNYPVKLHINQHNQIDTGQIKITEDIDAFEASINEKYSSLSLQIPEIFDEFEKINTKIKKKDYWLAESEINKISLAYKIFHRGYFNIDFSIKKLKAELGDAPSFDEINNFISKQSFWSLLFTYRIVRWPWLKNNLAITWAKQLCLSDVITQIEELKEKLSINNNEDLVKKIIVLLNAFSPYKKSEAVVNILNDFKEYVVAQLNQLERLELKINDCLNEKINLAIASDNLGQTSFFTTSALTSSATDSSTHSFPRPILVN